MFLPRASPLLVSRVLGAAGPAFKRGAFCDRSGGYRFQHCLALRNCITLIYLLLAPNSQSCAKVDLRQHELSPSKEGIHKGKINERGARAFMW